MTAFYDLRRLQHEIYRSAVIFHSTDDGLSLVEIEPRHKNAPLLDKE